MFLSLRPCWVPMWAQVGSNLAIFGHLGAMLAPSWLQLGHLGPIWTLSWAILAPTSPSWPNLGSLLGHLRLHLWLCWAMLVGPILSPTRPSWALLSFLWSHLGSSWVPPGLSWNPVGLLLSVRLGSCWSVLCSQGAPRRHMPYVAKLHYNM